MHIHMHARTQIQTYTHITFGVMWFSMQNGALESDTINLFVALIVLMQQYL